MQKDHWNELEEVLAPERPVERFVKVPLVWAAQAAKAIRDPALLVLLELLLADWHADGGPFRFPNARLRKLGVDRRTKYRVLAELERAGLAVVDRTPRHSPVVTLPAHDPIWRK